MWPPQDLAPISLSTQQLLRLRRHKAAIGYAALRHGGVIGGERRLPPCKCKAHGSLGRTRVPGGQSRASCRKLCHTPRRGLTRRSFSNSILQLQRGRVPGVVCIGNEYWRVASKKKNSNFTMSVDVFLLINLHRNTALPARLPSSGRAPRTSCGIPESRLPKLHSCFPTDPDSIRPSPLS